MASFQYAIRLTSDGEPGTGLGGELVDNLVPRDYRQRWMLPASHVKGLMRDALREISESLQWSSSLEDRVFGGHDEKRAGVESAVKVCDVIAQEDQEHLRSNLITRTSVEWDTGVAKDHSLRTTEAVPIGTVFSGVLHCSTATDSDEDLAWRLALLSIRAVGASRNRGCGACVVEIANERRSPGELLTLLHERRDRWNESEAPTRSFAPRSLSQETTVLRLVFRAHTPICCPESADKTNVLKSGFSIPASAVQGMILTRINQTAPDLANALFHSAGFRAWPLHPCMVPESIEDRLSNLPVPYRVPLTHQVVKGGGGFLDEVFDDAETLKGKRREFHDGVLLQYNDEIQFWRAQDMPREITAHGVLNDPSAPDGRNLFTVDAMAPMVWQGLLVMPADAAKDFQESLKGDALVAFGKSRSVRGIGKLHAESVDGTPPEWDSTAEMHGTVLVAQSPLLLDSRSSSREMSVQDELREIAAEWSGLNEDQKRKIKVRAIVGIRFGWNRDGDRIKEQQGFQSACRVALPGTVIALPIKLDQQQLARLLTKGFGVDSEIDFARKRGFGALSVHPGRAVPAPSLDSRPEVIAIKSDGLLKATQLVLDMYSSVEHLPSPSQIRAVQQRLEKSPSSGAQEALAYLDQQTKRTSRIWFTWEPIHSQIKDLLSKYSWHESRAAMKVLANLAIVGQKEDR